MALLTIRTEGEEVLAKKCKPVKEMTPRIQEMIEDMFETMYEAQGVGLAAPQVGILKQLVVIDVDDGNQYVIINPEFLETRGEQVGMEGCLSVPGKSGQVTRPQYVKIKCLNENFEEVIIEGEDLLARAICHECDHLVGKLYTELVEGELVDVSAEDYEDEE